MSKMSELDAAIKELRLCGQTLISISEALHECLSENKEAETPVEIAPEVPAKEEKEYSFIDVRAVLTEKSRDGKTAEVKALLRKYGAEKLSEIKPEQYAPLVAEAEKL